jgi:hypothetical protein
VAAEKEPMAVEKAPEVPPHPRWLFYVISFVLPAAGIVLGAVYSGKKDAANRAFGKYCLVAALVNVALGVAAVLGLALFYAALFLIYPGLIAGLLGVGAAGAL